MKPVWIKPRSILMMKWLAAVFLSISAVTVAQAQEPPVCRLKIGEDWVPMGATELQSCLKYAEAAASPGEPQYAEFGALSFFFKDGQYSQTSDGGRSWQRFNPRATEGEIGALNVLREGPAEPSADKQAKKAEKLKKDKTKSADSAKADKKATAKIEATPAIPEEPVLAPEPIPTAQEQASIVTPSNRQSPVRSGASGQRRSRGAQMTSDSEAEPHDCQIKIGKSWKLAVTPTLAACGQMLVKQAGSSQESLRAYWGGRFLLYHRNVLYQSSDGQDWRPL